MGGQSSKPTIEYLLLLVDFNEIRSTDASEMFFRVYLVIMVRRYFQSNTPMIDSKVRGLGGVLVLIVVMRKLSHDVFGAAWYTVLVFL